MRIRLTGLAIVLALAACNPQTGAQTGTTRMPLSGTAMVGQAATMISARRAVAGAPAPIVQNSALQAAAQSHADDLARTGRFGHTGSDGSTVSDRIRAAGYTPCFAAENIAQGQPDAAAAINSWAASPEHNRNMVSAAAQQFGFARAGDIWVLVLARPC